MSNNRMYIKSIATGQVYETDHLPQFMAGYEVVHEQTFIDYYTNKGFNPDEFRL